MTTAEVSLLRFADPEDGWAAGGALYSTHDGGATWTKLQVGPAGSAVTALATGGGYVYAAVATCPDLNGCTARTTLYASPVGADRFDALSMTVAGQIDPATLAVHGSDWFLVSATVKPQRVYHGRGLSAPTSVATPCPQGFGTSGIAAADATHLDLMCEGQGAAGSASWQLFGSTDGGAHWAASGPSHRLPTGLSAMSDNGAGALLVAAESGASELLRTTDDGKAFGGVLEVGSGGAFWGDAGFTTADQAVAVLPGTGAWLSHDAGASWTTITF